MNHYERQCPAAVAKVGKSTPAYEVAEPTPAPAFDWTKVVLVLGVIGFSLWFAYLAGDVEWLPLLAALSI